MLVAPLGVPSKPTSFEEKENDPKRTLNCNCLALNTIRARFFFEYRHLEDLSHVAEVVRRGE